MPASARAASAGTTDTSTSPVRPGGCCPGSAQRAAADRRRRWLLTLGAGHANDELMASMLASQLCGLGAMPDRLGLGPDAFQDLVVHHFPALRQTPLPQPGRGLDPGRADERAELVQLLRESGPAGRPAAGPAPSPDAQPTREQRWLAEIVAAGCMGSDHLWQDLGLWQRAELSSLMARNFPALAEMNHRDMKWKRFLYKQLCEAEGIHTCRAPSCEVCVDYHACFGPEN